MCDSKNYDFEETKRNVKKYFDDLDRAKWEWAKLNAGKGLTAKYDFAVEYRKRPYTPIGKDTFNLSAKGYKEEQLKNYLSGYYWAIGALSDTEQLYIRERFINHRYQDELVDMLGYNNRDSQEFRKLRHRAIYKFADFLNLVVRV